MIARFKLRNEIFNGRQGSYTFRRTSEDGIVRAETTVTVGQDGRFEIDGPPPIGLTIFAKAMPR